MKGASGVYYVNRHNSLHYVVAPATRLRSLLSLVATVFTSARLQRLSGQRLQLVHCIIIVYLVGLSEVTIDLALYHQVRHLTSCS